MNVVGLFQGMRAIGCAHAIINTASETMQALRSSDQKDRFQSSLTWTQQLHLHLPAKTSLLASASYITTRIAATDFSCGASLLKPVVANTAGLVSSGIDTLLEIQGIFHTTRFLNHSAFSKEPTLLDQLTNTDQIADPLAQYRARRELLPQLKKISAVAHDAIAHAAPPLELSKMPLDLIVHRYCNPASSYEQLKTQVEVETYAARLEALRNTYIRLTPEEEKAIEQEALATFPDNLCAQATFSQQARHNQMLVKQKHLPKRVGEVHARRLQVTVDDLLYVKLENPETQTQALAEVKELLQSTQTQAEKARFIHIVGLIGAAVCLISFALALFVVCPPLIPLIIGIIGTAIYVAQYLLKVELLENEGWKFSLLSALIKGFVPDSVIDYIKDSDRSPLETQSVALGS